MQTPPGKVYLIVADALLTKLFARGRFTPLMILNRGFHGHRVIFTLDMN